MRGLRNARHAEQHAGRKSAPESGPRHTPVAQFQADESGWRQLKRET
jgi:hypothetical protein